MLVKNEIRRRSYGSLVAAFLIAALNKLMDSPDKTDLSTLVRAK